MYLLCQLRLNFLLNKYPIIALATDQQKIPQNTNSNIEYIFKTQHPKSNHKQPSFLPQQKHHPTTKRIIL